MNLFSHRKGLKKVRTEIQSDSMDEALKNRLWNVLDFYYWKDARLPYGTIADDACMQGDVKLQCNKPLNQENRRREMLETRKELTAFLGKEKGEEKPFQDARRRAEDVLNDIARERSPQVEVT